MRLVALVALQCCLLTAEPAVDRALNYLSVEVPQWEQENGCFSCHNNGDGARALYAARRLQPLESTTRWLSAPESWDAAKADTPGSDRKLARYQFSAALGAAFEAGAIKDRRILVSAAATLQRLQMPDGSWAVEDQGEAAGSPVTWGSALATHFGRQLLAQARGHETAVARSGNWLRTLKPRHTADEAAVLLSFPLDPSIRKRAMDRFARTQTSDGGWGPGARGPAEVFDTAIVVLALKAAGATDLIQRGREFLVRNQQDAGGWVETTRPSGAQSYAQHVSTTAWAVLALLATDPDRN